MRRINNYSRVKNNSFIVELCECIGHLPDGCHCCLQVTLLTEPPLHQGIQLGVLHEVEKRLID